MALQPLVRSYGVGAVRSNGYRENGVRGAQWVERGAEGDGVEVSRMEVDTELEEGETVPERPRMEDLDSRFDYLDTKIEAVLGDCQKEWEGNLFHDKLGSKVGAYGSFLPVHLRGAPVLTGSPQTPAVVPPRGRPSDEPWRRLSSNGATTVSDRAVSNGTGITVQPQTNGVNHSSDGKSIIPARGNRRNGGGPLTVRINLNRGNKVGKKTIYNGFGLDNSSSQTSDEDPDDALSASDESTPDRSPCSMIRVMTSYSVPGGEILSPLSIVLTELPERKEKLLWNTKGNKKMATGSSAVKQEVGPGPLPSKPDSDAWKDSKVVKEKVDKIKGKPVDRREAPPSVDSGMMVKHEMENDGRTGKDGVGNGPKVSHKVSAKDGTKDFDLKGEKTDGDIDLRDIAGKEVDTLMDSARSLRKEKVFSMDVRTEDEAEVPFADSVQGRKAREELTKDSKKSRETSVDPVFKEVPAKEPSKDKRKMGGNKDASKTKREEEAPQQDFQKHQYRKDVRKSVEPVVVERDIPTEGTLEVKKRGKESSKGPILHKETKDKVKDVRRESKKENSKKEVFRDVGVFGDVDVFRDNDDSGKEEPKESLKASVRIIPKEPAKDVGKREGTDQGLKEAKAGKKGGKKGGKEPKAAWKEVERDSRPSGDLLGPAQASSLHPLPTPLLAGPVADANVGNTVPFVQPVLVLDHWVQCDDCQQWRLLSPNVKPEDLPDNWLCKMMDWLPGMNNCKHTEEATTAAVYEQLGLQNPQLNPALQAQQQVLAPALAPPAGLMPDVKMLGSKPVKVTRSASKKGMGKKATAGTVRNTATNLKRMEANSVKSKSLSDVGQHPGDQGADKAGFDAGDDIGYAADNSRKVKQKEKVKRVWANECDYFHPQKKQPVIAVAENGGEENAGVDSVDPELSKQQKGKLLLEGSKGESAGLKRKKKPESSEENDGLRTAKKGKAEETRNKRSTEVNPRRRDYDDLENHSLQYACYEFPGQEGESGDRGGGNTRNVARGSSSGQPFKRAKAASTTRDIPEAGQRNSFEKLGSSDSEKNEYRREEHGRSMKDKDVSRSLKAREGDGKVDSKWSMGIDDIEPGHKVENKRLSVKPELKDLGASKEILREEKKGQAKRVGMSPRTESHQRDFVEDHSREATPRNERVEDTLMRNERLFDEISGIARTYAERPSESPNGESPLPRVRNYTEQAGRLKGGSQLRAPPSSSSKVSDSAQSSAFGSKGVSPLESTVSSSPVRSFKVDGVSSGRKVSEGLQNNHTTSHSHPSDKMNSVSPSPKRSIDQDADTHSDRDGAQRQSHRSWDDGHHSSEPELEYKCLERDPARESASGRGRDDRHARSNSREGADFRKYDKSRGGREDDRYWEEGRETVAGSANYFGERGYDRHRDERYREREGSVDRHRDRDNRYERRGSREDRFRDRERGRERDRSRENWTNERSGDVREERYSRERQDRGGRPSSRESRLDKQGSWPDNPEIKHEMTSNHVEGLKNDHHPGEGDHEAAQDMQKDESGRRHDKMDSGPPKDAKPSFLRAPASGKASQGWEGDKVGIALSGRKDLDAGAPRHGSEAQAMTTHVNSRNRVDVMQSGAGSTVVLIKTGQVDGGPPDGRIVIEDAKLSKEHKKGADEASLLKGNATQALVTRSTEGAPSSLSKKEHLAQAKARQNEGVKMKHSADRLRNILPTDPEVPNLYLQASLKFLQAAHHHEMAPDGTGQSIKLYNDTAWLFEFCASIYEKQHHDHTAAALALICAAVARFRAVMGTSASLNKDCTELKNAASVTAAPGSQVPGVLTPPAGLRPQPPSSARASEKPRSSRGVVGESPSSSSASDVDNLNNQGLIVVGEKGLSANAVKGVAPSPTPGSVSGSTEIVPQRLNGVFQRTLRNVTDFTSMMDSWAKAQTATAAAEAAAAGLSDKEAGMAAVRRVVELGLLENIDVVVRQVRIALDAIGH